MNLSLSDRDLHGDVQNRKQHDDELFSNFITKLPEFITKYSEQYFREQEKYTDIEEFKKYFTSCMQDYINYRKHLKSLKNIKNHNLEQAKRIEGYQEIRPEIFLEYDKTAIVLLDNLKAKQEKFGYGHGGVVGRSVKRLMSLLGLGKVQ